MILPSQIPDWRNRQGNINRASILAQANRLVVVDGPPAANGFQNKWFLILTIRWDENRGGPANRFLWCVSKNPLGRIVPGHENAVEVLADDCVITRLNYRCQP